MRCSCGKPGDTVLERREMPYCKECFTQLIRELIRRDAGEGPVHLRNEPGYFLDAAQAACAEARREVVLVSKDDDNYESAFVAGSAETSAASILTTLLNQENKTLFAVHFPKSVTLKELQTFFKATTPVKLSEVATELLEIEKRYPGTINSINKTDTKLWQK